VILQKFAPKPNHMKKYKLEVGFALKLMAITVLSLVATLFLN